MATFHLEFESWRKTNATSKYFQVRFGSPELRDHCCVRACGRRFPYSCFMWCLECWIVKTLSIGRSGWLTLPFLDQASI